MRLVPPRAVRAVGAPVLATTETHPPHDRAIQAPQSERLSTAQSAATPRQASELQAPLRATVMSAAREHVRRVRRPRSHRTSGGPLRSIAWWAGRGAAPLPAPLCQAHLLDGERREHERPTTPRVTPSRRRDHADGPPWRRPQASGLAPHRPWPGSDERPDQEAAHKPPPPTCVVSVRSRTAPSRPAPTRSPTGAQYPHQPRPSPATAAHTPRRVPATRLLTRNREAARFVAEAGQHSECASSLSAMLLGSLIIRSPRQPGSSWSRTPGARPCGRDHGAGVMDEPEGGAVRKVRLGLGVFGLTTEPVESL